MRNRNTRNVEDFASRAEAPEIHPSSPSHESVEGRMVETSQDPRERMNQRLAAAPRKYPIANVLGNESVKELLDYAAQSEGRRAQDLIRSYLLLALEEKYGNQVPFRSDSR